MKHNTNCALILLPTWLPVQQSAIRFVLIWAMYTHQKDLTSSQTLTRNMGSLWNHVIDPSHRVHMCKFQ